MTENILVKFSWTRSGKAGLSLWPIAARVLIPHLQGSYRHSMGRPRGDRGFRGPKVTFAAMQEVVGSEL